MSTEKESTAPLPQDIELQAAAMAELLAEVVVNEGLISPEERCISEKKVSIMGSYGIGSTDVHLTAAMESTRIKRCLLSGRLKNGVVTVSNSVSHIVPTTFWFCQNRVKDGLSDHWEKEIMEYEIFDADILMRLVTSANYHGIDGIKNLICRIVAKMMKGKTNDEIRELFRIKDDFNILEKEVIEKAMKGEE